MERLVTLDHFEDVLRDAFAAGSEAMLIGGLAVGFWAKRFGAYNDPSEVMYSKDADLRGDRATYNLLIILLKSHGIELTGGAIVTRKEPPGMGKNYVIQVALPGIGRVSVEILEKMPLVDSPDLPPQGFAVEVEGIRVLDPLSLMIGKTHAWNHRPAGQSDNDARHLRLLRKVVPLFLEEACRRGIPEDAAERARALVLILDTWPLPFSAEELAAFRAEVAAYS